MTGRGRRDSEPDVEPDRDDLGHGLVRSVARNTTVQFVGEGLSKLVSLALYIVVARVAGPHEFGDLIFSMSLALLTTTLASFGVEGVIVRRVARHRDEAGRMLTDSITIRAGFGALGVSAAVAVALLGDYSGQVQLAVTMFAIGAVIDQIAKSYFAIFQALDDMRPLAGCLLFQRSWTAAVGITLVVLKAKLGLLSLAFLSGSVLAQLAASALLARRGIRRDRRLSLRRAWSLAKESFPLGVAQAFNIVLFRGDATMLSLFKGNLAVGIYGVAYRAFESTLFITYDFVAALAPTLARLRRDTTPSIARAYEFGCRVLALLLIPIGDVFVAFPHALVQLLYGSRYSAAEDVMRLLGGAAVTYGFSYLSMSVLVGQQRDRVMPRVHFIAAVQNVALNFVLIPAYSYTGAAISTTISEGTRTVMLMWHAVRATGPIRWGRIVLAPTVGSLALAGVAIGLGTGFGALLAAGIAYLGCVLLVEHWAFPGDTELIRMALLRRGTPDTQLG